MAEVVTQTDLTRLAAPAQDDRAGRPRLRLTTRGLVAISHDCPAPDCHEEPNISVVGPRPTPQGVAVPEPATPRSRPELRAVIGVLLFADVLFALLIFAPHGRTVRAQGLAMTQPPVAATATVVRPAASPTPARPELLASTRAIDLAPDEPMVRPSRTASPVPTPTATSTAAATAVSTAVSRPTQHSAAASPPPTSTPVPDVGGPAPGASVTPSATTTANPYAGDDLTNLSKVPDAEAIYWAAYVPAPVATPVPGAHGTGIFIWPVTGWITTPYQPTHLAIDIAGATGSPVVASDTGTVVFAGIDYGGLGYAVEIDHGNGYISAYGHNSVLKVSPGEIVRRGQLIAYRGSTGHSTGPHVHFAIHYHGQPVNPLEYLRSSAPAAPVPQLRLPKLVGLNQARARAVLRGLPLQLAYDPNVPSPSVPAGIIAVQEPAAGELVDVGSVIQVALSSGPPTPTPSPTATPATTPGAHVTATQTAEASPTATATATVAGKGQATPTATAAPTATVTPRPMPSPTPNKATATTMAR